MRRLGPWIGLATLWLVLGATIAWSSAALWFDGPSATPVAGLLAAGFGEDAVRAMAVTNTQALAGL